MSSFDTAREKWEDYHMDRIRKSREAAKNGDPEAMEIMASSIWYVQYNCQDEVIALLSAASDKGHGRASWKLADLYANRRDPQYDEKIEFYCRRAFEGGRTYKVKDEDDFLCGSIRYWICDHHPEWCEREKNYRDDGTYTLHPTGVYGINVFSGIGEENK